MGRRGSHQEIRGKRCRIGRGEWEKRIPAANSPTGNHHGEKKIRGGRKGGSKERQHEPPGEFSAFPPEGGRRNSL